MSTGISDEKKKWSDRFNESSRMLVIHPEKKENVVFLFFFLRQLSMCLLSSSQQFPMIHT